MWEKCEKILEIKENVKQDDKNIMRVKVVYKDKEESYPYIVVETNLNELPDTIELNTSIDEN